jgi:predicted SAM-dependent methyltransferase
MSMSEIKLNLGCGACQPEGWINTDSSLNALLQRLPVIGKAIPKLFKSRRYEINKAVYMDVSKRWKYRDNTVDVVYASHLFEHLAQWQTEFFLNEAYRVLKPGGVIRLVVPDLYQLAKNYVNTYETNRVENPSKEIMWSINMHRENMYAKRIPILKKMLYEWQGYPHQHKFMYDQKSLELKLREHGFRDIIPGKYGDSKYIKSIKEVEGDREHYLSVYLEALKPV